MKIDGMEATSYSSQKINSVDTPINTKPIAVEVKENVKAPHRIGHITEFEKKELPVSEQVVIDAIDRVNRALAGSNRKFEISIHEKTKGVMVKVIDSETNQLIREIPPEKILDMVAKLWEMAGLIVDERR